MANAVRMMRSWKGIYRVPGLDPELLRDMGRAIFRALLTLTFVYCALVGWDVVQSLREVKLAHFRDVLSLVSVGDALLLWVGVSLAREIIRSLARRRAVE
jgi:hypothetical protein